jgi:NADH-quinone oxidoreductase subunit N
MTGVALDNLASLPAFLPELVLAAGVLAVLFVGLVSPRAPRALFAGLAVLVAGGAIAATLLTAGVPRGLFGGLIARDPGADFFKLLAPLAGALCALLSLHARDTLADADREAPEYFALLLTAVLGAQLMAAANDLLMAYLALELTSLMSYVLAGYTRGSRRSAEAALKYVVYGGVASGVMLWGLSLLYGLAGSTDLGLIRAALAAAPAPVAVTAVALCLAGLGYKVAVVPFHLWCPDVYEGAPTPVAAFLSVAPKAGGFGLLLRFFPADAGDTVTLGGTVPWAMLALVVAIATMTLGNLAALGQRNIKRLLAYSSIAHAGYLFLGVASGPAGQQALLFYLAAYLFMNLAAFGVVIAVVHQAGARGDAAAAAAEQIESWAGLSRRSPFAAFVMAVVLFALAGLPPTAGFVGKYYLFSAVVVAGKDTGAAMYPIAALLAVLNSVVSLAYYLRVMRAMYIDAPAFPALPAFPTRPPAPLALVLGVLLAGTLFLGLYWAPLDQLTAAALVRFVPGAR